MKFTKYEKHGAYHWKQYGQGTKYKAHCDRIVEWIKEGSLIDVGAGDGKLTDLLQKKGIWVLAFDNELSAIKAAESMGITVRQADAYNIPYHGDPFESALMADVLEHFQYPEKALFEVRRVISKYLYITTPPANITPGKLLDKFHYQEWLPSELVKLVESQGFKLEGEVLVVMEEKNMYAKFKKI